MNKNCTCLYTVENDVIIRTFSGKVYVEDSISSWDELFAGNYITDNTTAIISDFSQAEFLIDLAGLKKFKAVFVKHYKYLSKLKLGLVLDSNAVVFPILFTEQNTDANMRVFSTLSACKDWVDTQ